LSRFKIKFKIQGLELEIEGDRRDVGLISRAVGDQVAGLVAPTNEIVDGERAAVPRGMIDITPQPAEKKPRKRAATGTRNNAGSAPTAIDFVHEPQRFGTPTQKWRATQKAMWLIFAVGELKQATQLNAGTIFATVNKHFRQAGLLQRSNVARDLGRVKLKNGETPPLVGEDTTKSPTEWFLTDEGKRNVSGLITESLGTPQAA
jgi:hypothetical protein